MLPPRIRRVVGRRGVPRRVVQLRLRAWRRQFRLTRLWATDVGPRTRITARANPTGSVTALADFEPDEERELGVHVRTESERILSSTQVQAGASRILESGQTRAFTPDEAAELARQYTGTYNIPRAAPHGVRSYQIPAGTTEAELAAAFRRMRPRHPSAGVPLRPTDPESLVRVLNFDTTGGRAYARQRAPAGRRHLEQVILGLVDQGGSRTARSLNYPDAGIEPGEAARVLRQVARRTPHTDQLQALAATMFGQEPTRSTAAFGHALFASDVDAFSRLNPGHPARVTPENLMGVFGGERRRYSEPGLAPFTGQGAIGDMQLLDDDLARRQLTPGRRARAQAQLAREAAMIHAWLHTQPDYVLIEFATRLDRMRDIKERITIRLERSAGLR